MNDWLAFAASALIALWVLVAGTLALCRFRTRAPRRIDRPAVPAGQGLRALTGLLVATKSSTYARDRVQTRLRLLADDLFHLAGPTTPGASAEVFRPQDDPLAGYFAEDHAGFKGSASRKHALDSDFLRRTEEVLCHLERHGNTLPGDPP
jgi:hypothetical protein